ncbi:MAG: hypothetical protein WCG48_01080 [Candidatus Berkelbacteria bacterium]
MDTLFLIITALGALVIGIPLLIFVLIPLWYICIPIIFTILLGWIGLFFGIGLVTVIFCVKWILTDNNDKEKAPTKKEDKPDSKKAFLAFITVFSIWGLSNWLFTDILVRLHGTNNDSDGLLIIIFMAVSGFASYKVGQKMIEAK